MNKFSNAYSHKICGIMSSFNGLLRLDWNFCLTWNVFIWNVKLFKFKKSGKFFNFSIQFSFPILKRDFIPHTTLSAWRPQFSLKYYLMHSTLFPLNKWRVHWTSDGQFLFSFIFCLVWIYLQALKINEDFCLKFIFRFTFKCRKAKKNYSESVWKWDSTICFMASRHHNFWIFIDSSALKNIIFLFISFFRVALVMSIQRNLFNLTLCIYTVVV